MERPFGVVRFPPLLHCYKKPSFSLQGGVATGVAVGIAIGVAVGVAKSAKRDLPVVHVFVGIRALPNGESSSSHKNTHYRAARRCPLTVTTRLLCDPVLQMLRIE
jgi:hypothetical protein